MSETLHRNKIILLGTIQALILMISGIAWVSTQPKATFPDPAQDSFVAAPATPTFLPETPTPSPTNTITPIEVTEVPLLPVISSTPTDIPLQAGPLIIGYSIAGRPLEIYRFGKGTIERLIVAGIHGGSEWNTVDLALELITYLQDHPQTVPDNITLYILPNINPDGYARAHGTEGRTNENGVDLNRNWPYLWQSTWDTSGCWSLLPVSAGAYPTSEPETLALLRFILHHEIDALISYHSAALGIFAGGVPDYTPSMRLAEAVAAVATYQYPPYDTGCSFTGNLTDWAAAQGIASLDIELSNHVDLDLEQNLKILHVFLNWNR